MKDFICNVCNGQSYKPIYEKQVSHPLWWCGKGYDVIQLRYVVCLNCGYITLFPRLSFVEYEENYRLVPGLDREVLSKRRKVMLEERKEFIRHNCDGIDSNTVVEVGPAYGDFLLLLSEFKNRVGIEPSSTYCEHVERSELPLDYRSCMLEDAPQIAPDLYASANMVVACHVLEHAENPRIFVRNLAGLVKLGGYVFIEVPSVEAMSECEDPIFQTTHFGHVSQFSIPVLNRLCISESLQPVRVEFTSRHDYPVIRALYQKHAAPDGIAELFRRHCEFIESNGLATKQILLDKLNSDKTRHVLVWGCGQDLFDVLDLLNESEVELLARKVRLVDVNKGKQGKVLYDMKIEDPAAFASQAIETVVVSSRSELIQSDIIKHARRLAPTAELILLYPLQVPSEVN